MNTTPARPPKEGSRGRREVEGQGRKEGPRENGLGGIRTSVKTRRGEKAGRKTRTGGEGWGGGKATAQHRTGERGGRGGRT